MLPFSVKHLLTDVDPKKSHGMAVTPTGTVAIYSSQILSIFLDTGKTFEPWFGAVLFDSPITSISWCKDSNNNGEFVYYLFASSHSGDCYVINVLGRTCFCSFNIQSFIQSRPLSPRSARSALSTLSAFSPISTNSNSYVTCSVWYPSSTSQIYVAVSTGEVMLLSISYQTSNVIWSYKADFTPTMIKVSPYDDNLIVIANEKAQFQIISVAINEEPPIDGHSKLESENLVLKDILFFPFSPDILIFVMSYSIEFYIISKECFVPFMATGVSQEEMVSIFFPDPTTENNIILIYPNQCMFVKNRNFDFEKVHSQSVHYLSAVGDKIDVALSFATCDNKLYVHGIDNTLQLFEFRNEKIWATRVSRSISSTPTDFDVVSNSIVFGISNGTICITHPHNNSCSLEKYIILGSKNRAYSKIKRGYTLNRVHCLSTNVFVVSGMSDEHPKVFLVDYSLMKIKSLLKRSMELSSNEPASVYVSKNHKFLAILIHHQTILFYQFNENYQTLSTLDLDLTFRRCRSESISSYNSESDNLNFVNMISYNDIDNDEQFKFLKTIFLENESLVTFSDKDEEFWCISQTNEAKRLIIDLKSPELILKPRTASFGEKWGKPQVCTSYDRYFIVGMHNGNVVLFDWYGNTPTSIQVQQKIPISLVTVPNKNKVFVLDSTNNLSCIDIKTKKNGLFASKISVFSIVSDSAMILQRSDLNGVSLYSICEGKMISPPVSSIISDGALIIQSLDIRKKKFLKFLVSHNNIEYLNDWIDEARHLNFTKIAHLLSALDQTKFCTDAFGSNMKSERIHSYFENLYTILDMTNDEKMRLTKMRLALLINSIEDAFSFLISEPPTNETFTLDVLKASLIHSLKLPEKLDDSIKALINGKKYNDAIDLLLISKNYKGVCDVLLKLNYICYATIIAKEKLCSNEKDLPKDFLDIIDKIVSQLKDEKKWCVCLSCLLISCHRFKAASAILHSHDYLFPSVVFNALFKDENGNICFDANQFLLE